MVFNLEAVQDILVCPKSKSKVLQEGNSLVCIDPQCRLQFEVRDDIPVMLIDEAKELAPDEWAAIMQKQGRDPATGAAPNEQPATSE